MDEIFDNRVLSTRDLHDRWHGKIKMSTLIQWRYLKRGPAYRKLGSKVVYRLEDVLRFEHGDARIPLLNEES
jgi:hypothetical protein